MIQSLTIKYPSMYINKELSYNISQVHWLEKNILHMHCNDTYYPYLLFLIPILFSIFRCVTLRITADNK